MDTAYTYLKRYPITLTAFTIYCICWISLFSNSAIFHPMTIGEWPIAPVIALPLSIIMILNAVFRKGHRLFYLIISFLIIMPFFIIGLMQS